MKTTFEGRTAIATNRASRVSSPFASAGMRCAESSGCGLPVGASGDARELSTGARNFFASLFDRFGAGAIHRWFLTDENHCGRCGGRGVCTCGAYEKLGICSSCSADLIALQGVSYDADGWPICISCDVKGGQQ